MTRLWLITLILVACALFAPLLFLPAEAPPPEATAPAAVSADADMHFTVLRGDSVFDADMAGYLPGAVAAEMPALFETEALKAQAVAIRSYIMSLCLSENPRHPEADVCTDPNCCKGWLSESELREKWGDAYSANSAKISEAVAATDGEYLSYGGEPIQAVFHASSAGQTESSADVWSERPYLVSVWSPETEENVATLVSAVTLTPDELRAKLLESRPEAQLPSEPEQWLGSVELTETGRVAALTVGSERLTGTEARSVFGLRSTDFDVEYTGGAFVFTVRGYGHGVGMSQEGANLLAEEGYGYQSILAHYYPGTELVGG